VDIQQEGSEPGGRLWFRALMRFSRLAVALIAILAIVGPPSSAGAASGTTTAPLSITPPPFMTAPATTVTTPAPVGPTHLPSTGLDLLPVALAGCGLLAVGAGLRRPRRLG
jgi:hypothetical protein